MDLAEVPAGEAHLQAGEMPVAVGHLEAPALDDDGAIAAAQGAPLGAGEGQLQRRAVRAGSRDLGTGEEAGDRGVAELGMDLTVVLVLHPGLGRLVEVGQGEVGTPSSMAISRPSTGPQNASCLPF